MSDGLAIRTSGLVKSYAQRRALDGLDLEVPRGVVYGFLGPNGAGKTTTMRILTGLIHADAGSVEVLGQPFTGRERQLLFDVGALIESPAFYPYLSGRDNLRVIAAAGPPTPTTRVDEVLALVGLAERAKDPFGTYSLGMKQRLGIASTLLNDPPLLLLDEPANGLDPGGIVQMRQTLRDLAAAGKTVFVSSHILPEIQQMADRVAIIHRGRLVREGPLSELLDTGGEIRLRVGEDQVARAAAVLTAMRGMRTPVRMRVRVRCTRTARHRAGCASPFTRTAPRSSTARSWPRASTSIGSRPATTSSASSSRSRRIDDAPRPGLAAEGRSASRGGPHARRGGSDLRADLPLDRDFSGPAPARAGARHRDAPRLPVRVHDARHVSHQLRVARRCRVGGPHRRRRVGVEHLPCRDRPR